MLGRLEGNGSICEQSNSYQYNQLPLEMLKAWWWKWNLLDSSGPIGLTEPTASKIITSSLLEKKGQQPERGRW